MQKIVLERNGRDVVSIHLCENQVAAAETANRLLLEFMHSLDWSDEKISEVLEDGSAGLYKDSDRDPYAGTWCYEHGGAWDSFIFDLKDENARFLVPEFEDMDLVDMAFVENETKAINAVEIALTRRIGELFRCSHFRGEWMSTSDQSDIPHAYITRENRDRENGEWTAWDAFAVKIPRR